MVESIRGSESEVANPCRSRNPVGIYGLIGEERSSSHRPFFFCSPPMVEASHYTRWVEFVTASWLVSAFVDRYDLSEVTPSSCWRIYPEGMLREDLRDFGVLLSTRESHTKGLGKSWSGSSDESEGNLGLNGPLQIEKEEAVG